MSLTVLDASTSSSAFTQPQPRVGERAERMLEFQGQ